jgi:hypothetical protein
VRLQKEHGIPLSLFFHPFAISAAGMVVAGIVAFTVTRHHGWFLAFSVAAGLLPLQLLAMLHAFPGLRKHLGQMVLNARGAFSAEKVPA